MQSVRRWALMGVVAAGMLLGGSRQASAQATADDPLAFFRTVNFSGLVDTYYTYNFNEPRTRTLTPLRNFDVRHNQFSLALVELALDKGATTDHRVGFRFDLDYGQVAQFFSGDPLDGDAAMNVQQAYIRFLAPIGRGLTLEAGKFVTPIGTEVTESPLNNNYSRSFLYALGPYYHVGARVSYPFSDAVALSGMVVNGWNATGDNNAGRSYGVTATITPTKAVSIVQNLLVGPEQNNDTDDVRTVSDTGLTVTLGGGRSTGLNYMYAKDSAGTRDLQWQGLALYYREPVTSVFAVAPRFEIFKDRDAFVTGSRQTLKEFTLTGELKHAQGLVFRAEYRRDWSDRNYFSKRSLPINNQNTFTTSVVVSFDSKR